MRNRSGARLPSCGIFTRAIPGMLIGVLIAGASLTPSTLFADDGATLQGNLFTAVAEKGDEEKIPEKLKPYRRNLLRVAKRFDLAKTHKLTLKKGKAVTQKLTGKLGQVKITFDGSRTTVELSREGKSLGTYRVTKFPFYLVTDKLKVNGNQVVLILDKKKDAP